LRWPEEGCPRETEPAAGGERHSGVRGRERPGWGDAVGDGEAEGATGLRRERAEGRAPRWTKLDGANGGAAAVGRARARLGGLL
jgi:hypothetical protein